MSDHWNYDRLMQEMSLFNVEEEAGLLVFSDWLEENGQDEWAYVFRLFRPSNLHKFPDGPYVKSTVEWLRHIKNEPYVNQFHSAEYLKEYYIDGWKIRGITP